MRPVGPREVNAATFTDVPIILDWYNKGIGTAYAFIREVSGNLAYVLEFMLTNPFTDSSPAWIAITGTNIAGVGKYFQIPVGATAVRVRTTTGTGLIRYGVIMPSGG